MSLNHFMNTELGPAEGDKSPIAPIMYIDRTYTIG